MNEYEITTDHVWERQRRAVHQLMDHIDEVIPHLEMSATSKNIFLGAVALYRCNRLLRSVDDAVARGFGDTVGGNVRTIYETWLMGHLVLIGDDNDIQDMWAMARSHGDKALRGMKEYVDADVAYPAAMPEAMSDMSTQARAKALGKKLQAEEPAWADLPELCYETIYRAESHLSVHVSANVLAQHVVPLGKNDATVGLNEQAKNREHHVQMGAYITGYFASWVFVKAEADTTRLDVIRKSLGSPAIQMPG